MFLVCVLAMGIAQVGVDAGPAMVSCGASTITLKATPINPPDNYVLQWEDGVSPGPFLVINPSETTQFWVFLTDLDNNRIYADVTRVLVHPGDPDLFPDGEFNDADWLAFYAEWHQLGAGPDFDPDGDGQVTILDFFYLCNFDVSPPNTPPSLTIGDALTYRDESVAIDFEISDNEQMAQLEIAVNPANGVVFPLGGQLFYDPDPGFTGTDQFEVFATDGLISTLNQVVTIEVLVPDIWADLYNNIFFVYCKACHIDAFSGGLSLVTYESAQMGGLSGAGFLPGNPDQSPLYLRVDNDTMPLMMDPLSFLEKERIRLWILRGAAP